MKIENATHICIEDFDTRFYENPSSGIRDVAFGQTDRQATTKPNDDFCIFVKESKNGIDTAFL
jgi:hypothetical protein